MRKQFDLTPLQEALGSAGQIMIAVSQKPNLDSLAAALALSLSLQKGGKVVSLVCAEPMTVRFGNLVGVDKVTTQPSGRNLLITFDYPLEQIEKVSYNDEGGKLNLVVQPKEGASAISPKQARFSQTGAGADLIFVVGASRLEHLGETYQKSRELFEKKQLVNIDHRTGNESFGKINLVDPGAAAVSELIVYLLRDLGLPVDEDISSNLYNGIEAATNRFTSPQVGAATFEAAALCLRAGARRRQPKAQPAPPVEAGPRRVKDEGKPKEEKGALEPMPAEVSAQKAPEEKVEEEGEDVPEDWKEPKIYKGSTLP